MGDGPTQEITVNVHGNDAGVQRVGVSMFPEVDQWDNALFDRLEGSMAADGLQLESLKCSRKTEPASVGNVVYVVKAPGKQATGLVEDWNCGHDGCGLALTIIYRKAEVSQFDCYGGA
jgi:hypothetical protein